MGEMPLSILLTNVRLYGRTGTELITLEVAKQLQLRGMKVAIYSPVLGSHGLLLRQQGIAVADRIEDLCGFSPDLIHGHHNTTTLTALLAFPGVPAIWFCHDPTSWHDRPISLGRIVLYVSHSEAVENRLIQEGRVGKSRIRRLPNAADTTEFVDGGQAPAKIASALVVAKYGASHVAAIERACAQRQIPVTLVGQGVGMSSDAMPKLMADHDLIFGSGRLVLEATASRKPAICVDERGLAGLVTAEVFPSWRARNFGGSILTQPVTEEAVGGEITLYSPADLELIVARHRDEISLSRYIDRLTSIYSEALALAASRELNAESESRDIARFCEQLFPSFRGQGWYPGKEYSEIAQLRRSLNDMRRELGREKARHFRFFDASGEGISLSFKPGEAGEFTLGLSWEPPDSWGAWCTGSFATISIPEALGWREAAALKFEGHVFAPRIAPFFGKREIGLRLNGIDKGIRVITHRSEKDTGYSYFVVSLEEAVKEVPGNLEVEIRFPASASPRELGLGPDGRRLGLKLLSLHAIPGT